MPIGYHAASTAVLGLEWDVRNQVIDGTDMNWVFHSGRPELVWLFILPYFRSGNIYEKVSRHIGDDVGIYALLDAMGLIDPRFAFMRAVAWEYGALLRFICRRERNIPLDLGLKIAARCKRPGVLRLLKEMGATDYDRALEAMSNGTQLVPMSEIGGMPLSIIVDRRDGENRKSKECQRLLKAWIRAR